MMEEVEELAVARAGGQRQLLFMAFLRVRRSLLPLRVAKVVTDLNFFEHPASTK